ncbi:hypothetical protein CONPUDRAFT_77568 [Coniophora puteana RWD-64-598 SS2]|uniref:Uncharacterized protein n=1 Tax=Coniophora puteana (strain RWD-64-598) TaxID=741705 RepID=A0A5M3M8K0_CONPW|nr:uncharacterized protein CONPUDRAFT_77568 [Coniophora puteana RWD-64-598 SS2]EIW75367.1 hypothetical protein CONPUDRAFT_77568 [Coniophora puteana RWD-64-598 SS2]
MSTNNNNRYDLRRRGNEPGAQPGPDTTAASSIPGPCDSAVTPSANGSDSSAVSSLTPLPDDSVAAANTPASPSSEEASPKPSGASSPRLLYSDVLNHGTHVSPLASPYMGNRSVDSHSPDAEALSAYIRNMSVGDETEPKGSKRMSRNEEEPIMEDATSLLERMSDSDLKHLANSHKNFLAKIEMSLQRRIKARTSILTDESESASERENVMPAAPSV